MSQNLSSLLPKRPSTRNTLLAACATIALVPLLLGTIDALYALSQAVEVQLSTPQTAALIFYDIGLFLPLSLLSTLLLTLAFIATPYDAGPRGLRGLLSAFKTAPDDTAHRVTAQLYAFGLSFVAAYAVLFKISHLCMVTFKNQILSALLLSLLSITWIAVMIAVWTKLSQALKPLCARLGPLGKPLAPLAIAAAATLALLAMIPILYAETWDALDLRAPVVGLILLTASYLTLGTLSNLLQSTQRSSLSKAAPAALVVAICAFFFPTLLSFGQSPDDASLVYTLSERSPLSRFSIKTLRKGFDSDKDGYASRLGGGDCDDSNPAINPAADEIFSNAIDEDCDGKDLDPLPLTNTPPKPTQPNPTTDTNSPPQADPLDVLRKKHNVLFIIVDTLRWDRMGYSGYKRQLTPNFDSVAKRGTIFENAYSVSAKTPTAIGPILAGRFPSEMERNDKHFIAYDDSNTFFAEKLTEQGYLTAASGGHWYFQRKYGYAQGFQRWRSYMVPGGEMEKIPTSKQITDNAIEMLTALYDGKLPAKGPDDADAPNTPPPAPPSMTGKKRPWFFFLHYFDPHKNYIDHEGFEPFGSNKRDRYDGEIRFTDHHFGRLLKFLESKDPGLKNTAIVFMSDHAESFAEHGRNFHGWDLFEHEIRTPFFFYVPGAKSQRIRERVSVIDSVPTLMDLLKVKGPDIVRGQSLLPQLAGTQPLNADRYIYTEMPKGPYNAEVRSFTVGRWKLIQRGSHYRFFDVEADPLEKDDLVKRKAKEFETHKNLYQRFRATYIKKVDPK